MRAQLYIAVILLIAGAALTVMLTFPSGDERDDSSTFRFPNIFLITVDTLRADHLGCYGYEKKTSPFLDRFAGQGMLFKNCVSQAPLTSAALSSLLTGALPHETHVFFNVDALPQSVITLPEILKNKGYTTMAVVSNPVLDKVRGWAQGFDIYDQEMNEPELNRSKIYERVAKDTTDRALALLKEHQDERIFLWVHYQDPHGPYTPPEEYRDTFLDDGLAPRPVPLKLDSDSGQGGIPSYQILNDHDDYHYYVSQYDGEIAYFDREFGRLVAGMEEMGLYEKGLIYFTADHGEGMGEHDYYFAHGEHLWHGLIHVPLIVRYGTNLRGVREDFVQHIDILPTLLCQLRIDPLLYLRGRDLRTPGWPPRKIISESPWYEEDKGPSFSLIEEGMKIIYQPIMKRKFHFYDLNKDPYETENLVSRPELREQGKGMQSILIRNLKEDRLQVEAAAPAPVDDRTRERLENLGY